MVGSDLWKFLLRYGIEKKIWKFWGNIFENIDYMADLAYFEVKNGHFSKIIFLYFCAA